MTAADDLEADWDEVFDALRARADNIFLIGADYQTTPESSG